MLLVMVKKTSIKSAVIILIKDDQALLQLRDNIPNISYPNHWGFAGGGQVDEGETFIQAAQRELKEETTYLSKNPRPLMVVEYKLPDGRDVHAERFFEVYDGIQKLECREGQRIEFFSLEKAKELQTYPGVIEAIGKAILEAAS